MSDVSRLPFIPSAELDRILHGGGVWSLRVEVMRPGDVAWTNLSDVAGGDWVVGVADSPAAMSSGHQVDQPVGRFTITLMTHADGRTLSPGITSEPLNRNASDVFAPLLYPGNFVRIYAGNAPAGVTPTMRPWRRGRVDDVEWPENDVLLYVSTPDGELESRAWIKSPQRRGAPEPGVPLEEEMADLLDEFADGEPLRVLPDAGFPGYASLGVGEYETDRTSLGPMLREWAHRVGADARYIWDEEAWQDVYTLFLPPRDKTTPDLVIGRSVIRGVTTLRASREYVRNDFELEYPNAATGLRETLTDRDVASIEQFGPGYMFIGEADGSPITTPTAAANLLAFARHDLAQPPTTKRVRLPFLPWLTLHDVVHVAPDDRRFNNATIWSVTAVRHSVTADEEPYTEADMRGGSPVGMYYGWHTRPQATFDSAAYGLIDVDEVDAVQPDHTAFDFEFGSKMSELWWAYRIVPFPPTRADWDAVKESVVALQPLTARRMEVPNPAANQRGLLRLEPRYRNGQGELLVYNDDVVLEFEIQPDAPQVALSLDMVQTGKNVDLLLDLTASASALPVSWEVREGGASGVLLADGTVATAGRHRFDKVVSEGLGGRYAPATGTQSWFAKATDASGKIYYDHIEAGALQDPKFRNDRQSTDPLNLLSRRFYIQVDEPGGQGGVLRAWINPDASTSADAEAAPTGVATVAAGDYTFGPSTAFGTAGNLLSGLRAHPGVVVAIYLEFIAADGRTTGIQRYELESSLSHIFDEYGEWVAGSIATQLAFASEFRGWTHVSSFAALSALTPQQFGNTKAYTYNPTTKVGSRYAWNGSGWVADTSLPIVLSYPIVEAGMVTAEVIATLALQAKLAGIERLTASNVNIGSLALISNDAGAIVYGSFINATGDAGLNLEATGSQRVLWGPGFEVRANGQIVLNHGAIQLNPDGTASFGGHLDGAGGSFAGVLTASIVSVDGVLSFGGFHGLDPWRGMRWENSLGTAVALFSNGLDLNLTLHTSGEFNVEGPIYAERFHGPLAGNADTATYASDAGNAAYASQAGGADYASQAGSVTGYAPTVVVIDGTSYTLLAQA